MGTVNQALTLECEIIKLAATEDGKWCGYFPSLALSVLKLFPTFMVVKDTIMNVNSSAGCYRHCSVSQTIAQR